MDIDNLISRSQLLARLEELEKAVFYWKKKYIEANGKWIQAQSKWFALDEAVKRGTVYTKKQEELNLTYEENQSLKDSNAQLRAELEQVKVERDAAVEDMRGICYLCNFGRPYRESPILRSCPHFSAVSPKRIDCPYFEWRGKEDGRRGSHDVLV